MRVQGYYNESSRCLDSYCITIKSTRHVFYLQVELQTLTFPSVSLYGQKYKALLKQLDLNIKNKVNGSHRTVLQECGPLNTCIRNKWEKTKWNKWKLVKAANLWALCQFYQIKLCGGGTRALVILTGFCSCSWCTSVDKPPACMTMVTAQLGRIK